MFCTLTKKGKQKSLKDQHVCLVATAGTRVSDPHSQGGEIMSRILMCDLKRHTNIVIK